MVSFRQKDRAELFKTNVEGTANLVDASLYKKTPRIIHLSSVAALGRSSKKEKINEKSPWEKDPNLSNYAISKFLSEQEVWRGQAEGLSVNVLYPSIILGGGDWSNGSTQLVAYADSSPKFYSTGSTGFVDVRDVAKAILLVLERSENGDKYLLNGGTLSYKIFLQQICNAIGKPAPKRILQPGFARFLSIIDNLRCWLTGSKPFLTKEKAHTAYQNYLYDASKSEQELGLNYRPLNTTITETANCYLATKSKGWGILDL